MLKEIVVQEITETTSLKMSTSKNTGVTSYLLESSSNLLRPDKSQIISDAGDNVAAVESFSAEDIIHKLSEIVKNNENYIPIHKESLSDELSQEFTARNLPVSSESDTQHLLKPQEDNDHISDASQNLFQQLAVEKHIPLLEVKDNSKLAARSEIEGIDENYELLKKTDEVIIEIICNELDKRSTA